MDDTEVEKMREERMEGIDSVHRYTKPKENMERFDEMLTGSTEGQRWCLRVRMAMQDDNKCLRDPVAFRTNLEPHVRTKTKYKAYPTYDLACPIVDSIEGGTHALRDLQYSDRDEQYNWFLDKLQLRKVEIWGFSRISHCVDVLAMSF